MINEEKPPAAKNLPGADPEVTNPQSEGDRQEDLLKQRKSWREIARMAFERARAEQRQRHSRRELGKDKTNGLIALVVLATVLVLVFFGVFSHPNKPLGRAGDNHAQASLGRKPVAGQQSRDSAVAPMLSADLQANDSAGMGQVTAEDIDRTSRTGHLTKTPASIRPETPVPDYALGKVDFSDPLTGKTRPSSSSMLPVASEIGASDAAQLKKPSLVFVRATELGPAAKPTLSPIPADKLSLPIGTRLLARLEQPVSSVVRTAVVAVVEYNYERDGEIVMPAGAKCVGRLMQASPSGEVALEFSRVDLPDGATMKLEAVGMDLNFKLLKGVVAGKRTGTKFLVRSLTGLGTMASYLVGPQASGSGGLISTNTLLRERLADNLALGGQQQLNELAFNQNLVVTIPANTRFYIVVQHAVSESEGVTSPAVKALKVGNGNGGVPTLEELRELMQLRREMNDLYTQNTNAGVVEP
ncbi:MAG: hypothetical protein JO356_19925 [Acidobacteria bacterium]|nr:hypothetical protein [Acidobacteriota bacterium]